MLAIYKLSVTKRTFVSNMKRTIRVQRRRVVKPYKEKTDDNGIM